MGNSSVFLTDCCKIHDQSSGYCINKRKVYCNIMRKRTFDWNLIELLENYFASISWCQWKDGHVHVLDIQAVLVLDIYHKIINNHPCTDLILTGDKKSYIKKAGDLKETSLNSAPINFQLNISEELELFLNLQCASNVFLCCQNIGCKMRTALFIMIG